MSNDLVAQTESVDEGLSDAVSKLSAAQRVVLEHLGGGTSIQETAKTTGVGRRTIHYWLKDDEKFAAAFNAWKRAVLESGRARALAMSDAALETIQGAIAKGNVNAAVQVAKGLGLLSRPKIGPEGAGDVAVGRALKAKRRSIRMNNKVTEVMVATHEEKPPKDIYEIDHRIEFLMAERERALAAERPEHRETREHNQQIACGDSEERKRYAAAIRVGTEWR